MCWSKARTAAIRMSDVLLYVMPKLTLSVDEKVVRGAKRYAAARGTSVSRLVERYLDLLSKPPKAVDQTPVLRMLRGAARGVPADAHRRHLTRKYR
jgi:hypothetical protein